MNLCHPVSADIWFIFVGSMSGWGIQRRLPYGLLVFPQKVKNRLPVWYVRFFLCCISEWRKQSVFCLIHQRMCEQFLCDVFWAYRSEPEISYASIWMISKKIKNRLSSMVCNIFFFLGCISEWENNVSSVWFIRGCVSILDVGGFFCDVFWGYLSEPQIS